MERLLVTLADAEDNATQQENLLRSDSPVLVSNEGPDNWSPRPWEGDGDGDEDEDYRHEKRGRARELAKKVVNFERKLAKASLDLCAFNLLIPKHFANWHL